MVVISEAGRGGAGFGAAQAAVTTTSASTASERLDRLTTVVPSATLAAAAREKAQELHALAEPAAQHRAVARHLGGDREDLAGTEVEAAVELLERGEDLGAAQVRVAEDARLHAAGIHQGVVLQPAARLRLAVQGGARIRRRQPDLDRCPVS